MGVHGKVVLKSDQENAILDVIDVCKQRGKEVDSAVTFVESSPEGGAKSNGLLRERCKILRESQHTS